MDYTAKTAQITFNVAPPPTDAYQASDGDLINLFVKQQIEIWGFDQVEKWFSEGFDLIVVGGKVIWVK